MLEAFFGCPDIDRREARLPVYAPYLGGCRYTLERLTAGFQGVTLETTREDMLLALIRGNALYHGEHLREVGSMVELGRRVVTTGGGAKIRGYIEAKRRWTGDFDYEFPGRVLCARGGHAGPDLSTGKTINRRYEHAGRTHAADS